MMDALSTLLPIGTTLTLDGQPLHIRERLKAGGLTGEVYRGDLEHGVLLPVAIKAMKPLGAATGRDLFVREGQVLTQMMNLEERSNQGQRLNLKVAPIFYGRGEYDHTPFLVMEFIQGRLVQDLLAESGHLPERQALTIAWHLYRTLDLMHTQLHKSYLDLKFEDLWWVMDSAGQGQLKMTDFGTLEDIGRGEGPQPGVRRDVLLGGVYLLAMLTGTMLRYSMGELQERSSPVLDHAHLSWGTTHVLRRLLHRNPQARPPTAALVAADLRSLVTFWNYSPDRLRESADRFLENAESTSVVDASAAAPPPQSARDLARLARSALGVLALQPGVDPADLKRRIERAESILKSHDHEVRGRALFVGESYGKARQVFEEGLDWAETPARLRHWAYLARIGEEVTPGILAARRTEIARAKDLLDTARWPAARQEWQRLSADLRSEGLRQALIEIDVFDQIDQAEAALRTSDFGAASQHFLRAREHLEQAVYRASIQEDIQDLDQARLAADAQATTRQASQLKMRAALDALQRAPLERLTDIVELLQEARRLDPEEARIRSLLFLVQALIRASADLVAGNSEGFERRLSFLLANPGFRQLPMRPALLALWGQAREQAAMMGDVRHLRVLGDLARLAPVSDPALAESLRAQAEQIERAYATHLDDGVRRSREVAHLRSKLAEAVQKVEVRDETAGPMLARVLSDCGRFEKEWGPDPVVSQLVTEARYAGHHVTPKHWQRVWSHTGAILAEIYAGVIQGFRALSVPGAQLPARLSPVDLAGHIAEALTLDEDVQAIQKWRNWDDQHARTLSTSEPDVHLLRDIQTCLQPPLPRAVWMGSASQVYFERCQARVHESLAAAAPEHITVELAQLSLEVEKTRRRAAWAVLAHSDRGLARSLRCFGAVAEAAPTDRRTLADQALREMKDRAWDSLQEGLADRRLPEFVAHLRNVLNAEWTARGLRPMTSPAKPAGDRP